MSVSWLSMSWAAVCQAELVQAGCQMGSPSSGGESGEAGLECGFFLFVCCLCQ